MKLSRTTIALYVGLVFACGGVVGFFANRNILLERLVAAGGRYTSTLLGVARLARPDLLIEIEATAVK